MIAEHFITRCLTGAFDDRQKAEFKTAAVSESFFRFPNFSAEALDNIISENISLPDYLETGGINGSNRGILRILNTNGILLVMRTYRVLDNLDTSGSVFYTHTYIFSGDDRETFLKNPQVFADSKIFYSYSDMVAENDINSGARIQPKYNLIEYADYSYDSGILEFCGFDRNSFANYISMLCYRISSGNSGISAIISDKITSSNWDAQGGSYNGELLMTEILRILPLTISRQFSGISFWDKNIRAVELKNIKMRILSGNPSQLSNIQHSEISYTDLIRHTGSSFATENTFGSYLWDIRENEGRLSEFNRNIDYFLESETRQPPFNPNLLDFLTKVILDSDKDNEFKLSDSEFFRGGEMLCSVFGGAIRDFPNICRLFGNIIEKMSEQNVSSDSVERLVFSAKETGIFTGTNTDKSMDRILWNRVCSGNASEQTVKMFSEIFSENPQDYFEILMDSPVNSNTTAIITSVYKKLKSGNRSYNQILLRHIEEYKRQNKYDICADMYIQIISKEKNINDSLRYTEDIISIYENISSGERKAKTARKLGMCLSLGENYLYQFFECFFIHSSDDKKNADFIYNNADFFPVFSRFLIHLTKKYLRNKNFTGEDYIRKWKSIYISCLNKIIENNNNSVSASYYLETEMNNLLKSSETDSSETELITLSAGTALMYIISAESEVSRNINIEMLEKSWKYFIPENYRYFFEYSCEMIISLNDRDDISGNIRKTAEFFRDLRTENDFPLSFCPINEMYICICKNLYQEIKNPARNGNIENKIDILTAAKKIYAGHINNEEEFIKTIKYADEDENFIFDSYYEVFLKRLSVRCEYIENEDLQEFSTDNNIPDEYKIIKNYPSKAIEFIRYNEELLIKYDMKRTAKEFMEKTGELFKSCGWDDRHRFIQASGEKTSVASNEVMKFIYENIRKYYWNFQCRDIIEMRYICENGSYEEREQILETDISRLFTKQQINCDIYNYHKSLKNRFAGAENLTGEQKSNLIMKLVLLLSVSNSLENNIYDLSQNQINLKTFKENRCSKNYLKTLENDRIISSSDVEKIFFVFKFLSSCSKKSKDESVLFRYVLYDFTVSFCEIIRNEGRNGNTEPFERIRSEYEKIPEKIIMECKEAFGRSAQESGNQTLMEIFPRITSKTSSEEKTGKTNFDISVDELMLYIAILVLINILCVTIFLINSLAGMVMTCVFLLVSTVFLTVCVIKHMTDKKEENTDEK